MNPYRLLLYVFVFTLCLWMGITATTRTKNVEEPIASTTPETFVSENTEKGPVYTEPIATTTSTTTQKTAPRITKTVSSTPLKREESVQTTQTREIQSKPVDFEAINTASRKAVVNILCTTGGNSLSPITGTGVVIDPRGIVLTNAHIGEYFLLRDFTGPNYVQCIIRTGSPAYPRYHAELMYISPEWVETNKDLLKQTNPKGTGEHDFALLRITDRIDKSPLENIDYIAPDTSEIQAPDSPVVLVSYPAGFLGGITISQDLNITSAITTIQKLFTFSTSTVDLISIGGTVVSQKGSSGGAVVNSNGNLIGIITTSSEASSTSERDLRAITLAHIDRTVSNETTGDFAALLAQDPARTEAIFNATLRNKLTSLITTELLK